jgi:C7-cyclitol 7-kinase
MPVIVVDAGGTYLRFGVAGDAGQLRNVSRCRIADFQSHAASALMWETILDQVASYVQSVEREDETGDAIVFAVPGPVAGNRRLIAAPTLIGADRDSIPDIARELTARTGRRVYLVNDVSAAAWYLGEHLESERFFVVTVSSGIGGKFFDRRHPERVFDAGAYAGEIGHIVVDAAAQAPLCDCGGRGHLGAISSGRGTERLARHLARSESELFRDSAIAQMAHADVGTITNEEHLIPAALQGDPWALSVIERAARPLAQALSALIASVGLDRVVVIGGFAQRLGAVYERMLSAHLSQLLDPSVFRLFAIGGVQVYADGEEVCLAGAGAFYRAQLVGFR